MILIRVINYQEIFFKFLFFVLLLFWLHICCIPSRNIAISKYTLRHVAGDIFHSTFPFTTWNINKYVLSLPLLVHSISRSLIILYASMSLCYWPFLIFWRQTGQFGVFKAFFNHWSRHWRQNIWLNFNWLINYTNLH